MYKALDIARYIIFYCKENGYYISNLKLTKNIIFCSGGVLSFYSDPMFSGEYRSMGFWTGGAGSLS